MMEKEEKARFLLEIQLADENIHVQMSGVEYGGIIAWAVCKKNPLQLTGIKTVNRSSCPVTTEGGLKETSVSKGLNLSPTLADLSAGHQWGRESMTCWVMEKKKRWIGCSSWSLVCSACAGVSARGHQPGIELAQLTVAYRKDRTDYVQPGCTGMSLLVFWKQHQCSAGNIETHFSHFSVFGYTVLPEKGECFSFAKTLRSECASTASKNMRRLCGTTSKPRNALPEGKWDGEEFTGFCYQPCSQTPTVGVWAGIGARTKKLMKKINWKNISWVSIATCSLCCRSTQSRAGNRCL